jgi:hypothetical protein
VIREEAFEAGLVTVEEAADIKAEAAGEVRPTKMAMKTKATGVAK